MQVKKITAANMQQALREVTQQLGPDAAIISTRKVAQGMEVVAALNYQSDVSAKQIEAQLNQQQPTQAASKHKTTSKPNAELEAWLNKIKHTSTPKQAAQAIDKHPPKEAGKSTDKPQPQAPFYPSSEAQTDPSHTVLTAQSESYNQLLIKMNEEMQSLKKHIERQQNHVATNSAWDNQPPMNWQQSQLLMRCRDAGIEPEWAEPLVLSTTPHQDIEQAWKALLQQLQKDLPIEQSKLLSEGGCYAFVGATGAGKTTTIGKLAAQFAMRHGADKVTLVTLDQYRVAAHEQLKAFARIMGIQLVIINDAPSLKEIVQQRSKKQLILIDSAGLSPQSPHFSQQLSMLNAVKGCLETLLVLPLTNQARCLQENFEHYKKLKPSGCVLTKLDESFSLGAALSVATLAELPITFITDGPQIPDDIHQPEAKKLVQLTEQMAKMAQTRWQIARSKQIDNHKGHSINA